MNIKNIILPAALIFASIASAATTPAAESAPQTAPAEKSWTHSVDFGLAFPIAKYKVDGKKVGTVSYTLDINYLGVARNGFSLGGAPLREGTLPRTISSLKERRTTFRWAGIPRLIWA